MSAERERFEGAPASIGAILDWARRTLASVSETPRLDAELLLAHACGTSRSSVVAFPEREIADADAQAFRESVSRRHSREPVAYILGEKEFYSLAFSVGRAVLVPRPETELVVDAALSMLEHGSSVLDLGTGSGAIAIAIKHACPAAAVTAVDSCLEALSVARSNAARHGVDVRFAKSRWFDALPGERFDLVVCNPPYVPSAEIESAALAHEPRAALDGGPDGLTEIRGVLAAVSLHLEPQGLLILEHGADQQASVIALAEGSGLELCGVQRDGAGRDRVVILGSKR